MKKALFFEEELIKTAGKFVEEFHEKIFSHEGLSYLNFSQVDSKHLKSADEIEEGFKKFLIFWSTTVLLVIEGYF